MAPSERRREGRDARLALRRAVRPGAQQPLRQAGVPALAREDERGAPLGVAGLEVGAGADEQGGALRVALGRRLQPKRLQRLLRQSGAGASLSRRDSRGVSPAEARGGRTARFPSAPASVSFPASASATLSRAARRDARSSGSTRRHDTQLGERVVTTRSARVMHPPLGKCTSLTSPSRVSPSTTATTRVGSAAPPPSPASSPSPAAAAAASVARTSWTVYPAGSWETSRRTPARCTGRPKSSWIHPGGWAPPFQMPLSARSTARGPQSPTWLASR